MGKRGPAPRPANELRGKKVSVHFTTDELKVVDTLRGGRSRGRYIRDAVLKDLPPSVPELNREAWLELSKAAANLNQIAHHLNTGGDPDFAAASAALADFRCRLIGANGGWSNEGGDDEI